jgi:4-amino-4-deoxy-L-arabinose transferase-like glycosyltransferase
MMRSVSSVRKTKFWAFVGLLLVAGVFRVAVARWLPNDAPDDGRVYAQMARNILEQHVYSASGQPPYNPTLIRLPGYSIFLAAIYSVFGHYNNSAVRIIQALIDTATCILVAIVAFYWESRPERKRSSATAALALAAINPFTAIYVATILTEALASFLAITLCLLSTLALSAADLKRSLWWWMATGLVGSVAVFIRPDMGLFVAAAGIVLVLVSLFSRARTVDQRVQLTLRRRAQRLFLQGALLSVAFVLVLIPWTIRNWRIFHVFEPLAPSHAEMPGEFVPRGYETWLKTWLDDRRYIGPMLWSLWEQPIDIDDIPDSAFNSDEERARVEELIDQYNEPAQEDEEENEEGNQDIKEPAQPQPTPPPDMTPEIDAEFGQIARERIARAPLRYYVWLPLKRAMALWFDTHSEYYPFDGELFPLDEIDYSSHQQIWLPIFAVLVWLYTLLGIAGGWVLLRTRQVAARRFLLLAVLMIFLRVAFFSTVVNPEPRYVVEIFPFLSILGGLALGRIALRVRQQA